MQRCYIALQKSDKKHVKQEGITGMQQPMLERRVLVDGVNFNLTSVDVPMSWAGGAIKRPEIDQPSYDLLVNTAAQSIVPVDESNIGKSGCTDGRVRLHKLDDSEPEDWQKTVGADVMEMFVAAEALGAGFYGDQTNRAPVMDRFNSVLEYMVKNNLTPTTHEGCGARAGLVSVLENGISYASDMSIVDAEVRRLSLFAQEQVDGDLIKHIADSWQKRDLAGYDEAKARELIIQHGGTSGVEVLKTDDSPNHGHTEALILRMDTPGYTYSTRKNQRILQETNPELSDMEAFAVNDDRINNLLAPIIADTDIQRKVASVAMHYFADAGHATLSSGLTTYHLSVSI